MNIKNDQAILKIIETGKRLVEVFDEVENLPLIGMTTYDVDQHIKQFLTKRQLVSCTYLYKGYKGYSCLSLNHEIIHGLPSKTKFIKDGDLLKVDICASFSNYCADRARMYQVGTSKAIYNTLMECGRKALDAGIAEARVRNTIGDIGYAIEKVIKSYGFDVVLDFCGHGIGKSMHEDPEIPNYGKKGQGMVLRHGMALAIEPMFVEKKANLEISNDLWTVYSKDGSYTAHIEDTIIVTDNGPIVVTK